MDNQSQGKKLKKKGKSLISSIFRNFEHHLQLDSNVRFSDEYPETSKDENSNKKLKRKKSKKVKRSKSVKRREKSTSVHQKNEKVEDDKTHEDEQAVPEIDSMIFEVYTDVLRIIFYHWNKEDTDLDMSTSSQDSAVDFIKYAFAISSEKHNEIYENTITIDSPNIPNEACPDIFNFNALEEHRCLMKIILTHQLKLAPMPDYSWDGKFSNLAKSILDLHAESKRLDDINIAFIQWSAFIDVHSKYPLNLKIFIDILEVITESSKTVEETSETVLGTTLVYNTVCIFSSAMQALKENKADKTYLKTQDEAIATLFWDSSKLLIETFLKFVGNLYKDINENEFDTIEILENMAEVVKKLKKIKGPETVLNNLETQVKCSIQQETSKHLLKFRNNTILKGNTLELKTDVLIKLTQTANEEYGKMVEKYGKFFEGKFQIPYNEILYEAYDSNIKEIVKPCVIEISKKLDLQIDKFSDPDAKPATKKLFELYVHLKSFADKGLVYKEDHKFGTMDYFRWFIGGYEKWNEESVFSALSRMKISIFLDKLRPSTKTSKHSSSAIEMLLILASVKKFWEDLKISDESDAEEATHKIVGDVCRFSIVYFDSIIDLLDKKHVMKQYGLFQIPSETTIALSNIEFIAKGVREILIPETENAPLDEYTKKCLENSFKYGRTLAKKVIKNHINMMVSSITKLIIEGADVSMENDKIGDRFILYIEDTLDTFNRELHEKGFLKSRKYLQDKVLDIFIEIIEKSLKMNAEPVFFTNLKIIFNEILHIFQIESCNKAKIEKIQRYLDSHCLNASKLIHQYFKDRHKMQNEINKIRTDLLGELVIRCFFSHNVLKIVGISAENLRTINGNQKFNSYVKINFYPKEMFSSCQHYKIKIKRYLLYNESFEIQLTSDQRNVKDALISLRVMEKSLFVNDRCIGEAFLLFNDIPDCFEKTQTEGFRLPLTKLENHDMDSLRALNDLSQSGDKTAENFLVKIKKKSFCSANKVCSAEGVGQDIKEPALDE